MYENVGPAVGAAAGGAAAGLLPVTGLAMPLTIALVGFALLFTGVMVLRLVNKGRSSA